MAAQQHILLAVVVALALLVTVQRIQSCVSGGIPVWLTLLLLCVLDVTALRWYWHRHREGQSARGFGGYMVSVLVGCIVTYATINTLLEDQRLEEAAAGSSTTTSASNPPPPHT